MLTPDELLWTEIGASFCWMVVSGLFALYWVNRARMGTRGFSPMPLTVFGGVLAPIAALLTAHTMAGKVLTTAGGVPRWTFFFPLACLAGEQRLVRGGRRAVLLDAGGDSLAPLARINHRTSGCRASI